MSAITQLWPDGPESPDQALLFAAVQNSPASLAVVDSWIVLYANSAWEEMFEPAGRLGARGRSVEDFIPGQIFQTLLVGQSDRGKTRSLQFPHLRPDGSRVQLEMACANFRMKGRELQVVSASQAGQPKSNEIEMAKAANLESVGRLTGGVAHDFNNLLTGIILYCDLLIAELEKDSRSRHHAREIRKAGEQGARLVRQLLAVARPQAAEHREFALNEVVIGLQELLTRLIGENIVLTTSLDADLGTVRMDPVHLQQVLLNLVLNARDAMPDGGEITIATRNCIDYVKQEEAGRWETKPWETGRTSGQGRKAGTGALRRVDRQRHRRMAWMPKPWAGPSSLFSQPRVLAGATAWAWPRLTDWPNWKAAESWLKVSRERARESRCCCPAWTRTPPSIRCHRIRQAQLHQVQPTPNHRGKTTR